MASTNDRVHILDGDSKRRAAIAYHLATQYYLPQIYEDLDELVRFPPREGVLLLNDGFAGPEMSQVTRTIAANEARVPIIVFGERPATEAVVKAMLAGAIDYLEWPFGIARFEHSIERAHSGGSTHARAAERKQAALLRIESLTGREREVLTHLIQGRGSKDIGLVLGISPRTVEVHRASLLVKLAARSTADAIRIGIHGGLDD